MGTALTVQMDLMILAEPRTHGMDLVLLRPMAHTPIGSVRASARDLLLADRAPTGRGLLLPPLRLEAVRLHPCEARPLPVAFSIAAHHHRLTAVFEALLPAAKLSTPSLVSFLALPAPIGETYQLPVLPGGALQRSYVGDPVPSGVVQTRGPTGSSTGCYQEESLAPDSRWATHSPEAHSRCTWGSGAAAYAHHTSAMGFRSGSRGTCKVGFPDFGSRCCA